MKYILILTLIYGNDGGYDGQGGIGLSQQEYNTVEACQSAGEYWEKHHAVKPKGMIDIWQAAYFCAPKG